MRVIPPHDLPAEHQVETEAHARDEGREEHKDQGDEVVEGLEGSDLACDLKGGQFGEGASAGGLSSSCHDDDVCCVVLGRLVFREVGRFVKG